jgi:predicted PurR-regulated permease PerM
VLVQVSTLLGRRTLAASLMTGLVTLVLIAPFAVVVATLADNVTNLTRMIRSILDNGMPAPPAWLDRIPVAGAMIVEYWKAVAAGESDLFASAPAYWSFASACSSRSFSIAAARRS